MQTILRYTAFFFLLIAPLFSLNAKGLEDNLPLSKVYSMEECKTLGLKPLILEDGTIIMPKHDGKNFFVDLEENHPSIEAMKAEDVRALVTKLGDAGKKVNDILSVHLVSDLPVVIHKDQSQSYFILNIHNPSIELLNILKDYTQNNLPHTF